MRNTQEIHDKTGVIHAELMAIRRRQNEDRCRLDLLELELRNVEAQLDEQDSLRYRADPYSDGGDCLDDWLSNSRH